MRATGFTHVSVSAGDMEASVRFYKDFFGMDEVPSPEFSGPVRWLRVGNLQLHLFHDEEAAPPRHHFALDVDDFEEAFRRAEEMGVRVASGNFSTLRRLPGGEAQMYIKDPGGNLVEINGREVDLDREIFGEVREVGGPPDARVYMDQREETGP